MARSLCSLSRVAAALVVLVAFTVAVHGQVRPRGGRRVRPPRPTPRHDATRGPRPGDPCSAQSECDNGRFCDGVEACVGGICVDGDWACSGFDCLGDEPLCIEATHSCECPECADDSDCDDGAACNGSESCIEQMCSPGTPPCAEFDCGAFVLDCIEDANGAGCTCVACLDDSDCDDGLYCNGIEACVEEECVGGADPCDDITCGANGIDEPPTCQEDTGRAECSCPEIVDIWLTLAMDNVAGTEGDDFVSAPLEFSAGTGLQTGTLQDHDIIDGRGGYDEIGASVLAGELAPTLISIERIALTVFRCNVFFEDCSDQTLEFNAEHASDVTELVLQPYGTDILVESLIGARDIELRIYDSASRIDIEYDPQEDTSSDDDTISIVAGSTEGGTVNVATHSDDGFELLEIFGPDHPARLDAIEQSGTTQFDIASFFGDQRLSVGRLPDTVRVIDAIGCTGGLLLGQGSTVEDFAGFTMSAIGAMSLGIGDDIVIFGATLDELDFDEGPLDCAGGADEVQVTVDAEDIVVPVESCETVRGHALNDGSVLAIEGHGVQAIIIDADGTSNTLTIELD